MQFPPRPKLSVITFVAVAIGVLLAPATAAAVQTCTWSGSAGDNKWSTSGNWTAGGGGSCPPSGILAQFTGGAINCNIDVNATPSSISISGYNGIVTQQSGKTVTLSGAFTQSTGTFVGGDSAIDISGAFNFSGGTFKVTSGRMAVGGQFNATGGTFTAHPAGTYIGRVLLKSTTSQTFNSNGISFNDLYINDGLAGYWKLDEGTSTNAADASGYGNAGILQNSATWATSGLPSVNFSDAAAVTLNGSNQYVDIATPVTTTNAAFTACAWVKFSSVSGSLTFLSETGTHSSAFILKHDSGGKFAFLMTGSDVASPVNYQTLGTTTPATGTWYHVCGVYSGGGGTGTLYVNGSSEGTPVTVSSAWAASGHTYIGAVWWSDARTDYFPGTVDDVRIYSRALSAAEISSLGRGYQPGTSLATQTLSGSPTITGDLTIASGTLAIGANTLNVAGSLWTYSGTFSGGTGTVAFNGSSSGKSILVNGSSFNNLTVSGTGAWSIADTGQTVTVGGNVTLSAGTFTSTSGVLKVGGAFNNSGGTFTHNSGTVMLTSTSSQTFATNGATFNNLTINDGLVGYWKVDDGSGTTATDSSGYGNSGTFNGSPSWSGSTPTVGFPDTGAITFDGASYLDIGVPVTPSNAADTVCAWVNFSSLTGFHTFVSIDGTNMSGFYLQRNGTTGKFGFGMRETDSTSGVWDTADGTTTVATGTWYQVCGVYTGSAVRLFVNGAQESSNVTVSASWNATGHTIIGAAKYGGSRSDWTSGTVDDVRIYNRALSGGEISALYLGNQPGTYQGTQTMTGSPTVAGDLTLLAGRLDIGANTLNVNGNWWSYGGALTASYSGGGTVAFTGSSASNKILSAGQVLPNLSFTGLGTWTLLDNLDVDPNDTITLTAGSLNLSTKTVRAGNLAANSTGAFTTTNATVILDSASNQTVNVTSYKNLRIEDPAETNLVGYWKFDHRQGNYARDWTGNGHTATLMNGAS